MKFLMNCPLKLTFTKSLSVLYQNLLREFWSTTIAYDPNPPTDDFVDRLPKEVFIKFSVMNDQPFTLDFNIFLSSTGPETSKSLPQKRKKTKSKKPPTKTKEIPPLSQQRVLSNPTQSPQGTTTNPKDSWGNVQPTDKGLPSMASNEGAAKTTPHPEGPLGDKDSKVNKPPTDMEPINPTVSNPSGTGAEYQESDEEEVFAVGDDMEEENQADEEEHQSLSPNKDKPKPSHTSTTQESNYDSSSPDLKKFDNTLSLTKRKLIKASIEGYYEENIDHREKTDKLVQATMDSLDKTATDRVNLLKALNGVIETLKVADIISDISSLKQDTSEIKSMMTYIYQAFKGENDTQADTKEPPSHTKGKHVAMKDDTKKLRTNKAEEEPTRAVPISTVRPSLTNPILKILIP
ncbi:hypothetical protein Tco_1091623 [Tanacetum coccineum]|uniref:BAG domain-containing protein n=1 Tax=Tanacetum coccineum TaxID=301880 RepID=A0ABQ5I8X1_9ASTR